jgi:hypothetical protein
MERSSFTQSYKTRESCVKLTNPHVHVDVEVLSKNVACGRIEVSDISCENIVKLCQKRSKYKLANFTEYKPDSTRLKS